MTPAQILALINTQIISNGIGGITGPILNNILTLIVGLFTAPTQAARIVTASTALTVQTSDYAIGLLRSLNLLALNAQLPSAAVQGQEFVIQDLSGNFSAYPVTVLPPAGQTIVGRTSYVMNEDNQTSRFRFYGSNIWGVEPA